MLISRIQGATREMAKGQPQYKTLAIRDEVYSDGTPVMTAQWEFTPQEVALVQEGAPFLLSILGTGWPPVIPWIGAAPTMPDTPAPVQVPPIVTTSLATAAKAIRRDLHGRGNREDYEWLGHIINATANACNVPVETVAIIFGNLITGLTAK